MPMTIFKLYGDFMETYKTYCVYHKSDVPREMVASCAQSNTFNISASGKTG